MKQSSFRGTVPWQQLHQWNVADSIWKARLTWHHNTASYIMHVALKADSEAISLWISWTPYGAVHTESRGWQLYLIICSHCKVKYTAVFLTPWPEPASELYRPSDRRLSTKLVPTFCGWRVTHGQRDASLRPYSGISRPELLLFLSNSSSVVLTRLSEPRSRPITSQKIW
jgi:hypothetical protein